jgi:hypothetical protein
MDFTLANQGLTTQGTIRAAETRAAEPVPVGKPSKEIGDKLLEFYPGVNISPEVSGDNAADLKALYPEIKLPTKAEYERIAGGVEQFRGGIDTLTMANEMNNSKFLKHLDAFF